MVIAIFAPEVVLWCAFEQFRAARQLRDAINKLGQRTCDGDLALQVNAKHLTKDVKTYASNTADLHFLHRVLLKPGASVRIYLLKLTMLVPKLKDQALSLGLPTAKPLSSLTGHYLRPFTPSVEALPSTPLPFGLKTASPSPLPEYSNSQI